MTGEVARAAMSRRWVWLVAGLALVALACKSPARGSDEPPPKPTKGYPSTMVALGDSITTGFATCLAPVDCPRNSWSTGDGTRVTSHYRMIKAVNPAIAGHARNLAASGATAASLRGQAAAAVKRPAQYVTILIGANDACHGGMTSASAFRQSIDAALATLHQGLPQARVLMVSLPDVYHVWEVGHTSDLATRVWQSGKVCPNLLAAPRSTAADDVTRRATFRDRIATYNAQLRKACAEYGAKCRFDDVSRLRFDLSMLSAVDFFHPNSVGQQELAEQTYPTSFRW